MFALNHGETFWISLLSLFQISAGVSPLAVLSLVSSANMAGAVIAAERASLKRASEAANLIYVYGENLSQTTVYRHRGKTSAHARALKMAENLKPTFVNKNMAIKN